MPDQPALACLLSFPLNSTGLCKYRWTTEPAAATQRILALQRERGFFIARVFYCASYRGIEVSTLAEDSMDH